MILTAGCSTKPVVTTEHANLICLGYPDVSQYHFTADEFAAIPESARAKITGISATYKARIDSICEVIKVHNNTH